MFDILKRSKDRNGTPILCKLWVCAFDFEPWNGAEQQVVFELVDVIEMEAREKGIWVKSNDLDPFREASCLDGYLD